MGEQLFASITPYQINSLIFNNSLIEEPLIADSRLFSIFPSNGTLQETKQIHLISQFPGAGTNLMLPTSDGLIPVFLYATTQDNPADPSMFSYQNRILFEPSEQITTRPGFITAIFYHPQYTVLIGPEGDGKFNFQYLTTDITGYNEDILLISPTNTDSAALLHISRNGTTTYQLILTENNKPRNQFVRIAFHEENPEGDTYGRDDD
jgi:hypothetical protein